MQNYAEFLDQSVNFPQEEFKSDESRLFFHNIDLMDVIEKHGTPLRFTYLPIISKKIQQAKLYFQTALLKNDYQGKYYYCYCTKSSHFKHVMDEALKNNIHLETSSAYDMPIIESLEKTGQLTKDMFIVCNGYKRELYKDKIIETLKKGYHNLIPVLDNMEEFNYYKEHNTTPCDLGIRIASEEQPGFDFYTSRLGIRAEDAVEFYLREIKPHKQYRLKLFHFFINDGISDSPYYWSELEKHIQLFCKLKKVNPHLSMLDIGGGFPFKNSLSFDYDYEYMAQEIVARIKAICAENNVEEPDIVTEFGKYTVAESQGTLFSVLGKKQQNDREKWFMLDGSFITTLPDVWAINQRYILLPINNWDAPYTNVNLGGITCDGQDYYNQEAHVNTLFLPDSEKQQYIGFFHTGAYQEVLSGAGGIHHCLIPTPKHILIQKDKNGKLEHKVFAEEQDPDEVLKILGYKL
jgi:arginine decarboxylase